ncbi:hypothetical protein PGQ11_010281 [Apiospora arundinis]|uniref:Peptidylprolyl isomerase n=1 Tax=Apiospora arundinis TaxID=335852 RepID=A0ABR2I977_9PEZI
MHWLLPTFSPNIHRGKQDTSRFIFPPSFPYYHSLSYISSPCIPLKYVITSLPPAAVSPAPPLPSKRGQGAIGSDLVITYHSDLAQCEILPAGSRYTNAGNLTAGTFLAFNPPPFIDDLYPQLLSIDDDERPGLPLLLSNFNADVQTATLEED